MTGEQPTWTGGGTMVIALSRMPERVADNTQTFLASIITHRELQRHEGRYSQLPEIVADKLTTALPRCNEHCRMRAELTNIDTGMVTQETSSSSPTALVLSCAEVAYSFKGKAHQVNTRCAETHLQAAAVFGGWVQEAVKKIAENSEDMTIASSKLREAEREHWVAAQRLQQLQEARDELL